MDYKSTSAKLAEFRSEIAAIRKKMRAAQAGVEPEEVADYQLATLQGTVRLSELFGGKADLILIHNMGTTCPNCTLWADGLNGIYHHLLDRAAVVVTSPDPPEVQQRFLSKSRQNRPAYWIGQRKEHRIQKLILRALACASAEFVQAYESGISHSMD